MNKLIFVILFYILTNLSFASDFCEGFKRGYITGYKHASGSGYDPYTPYCPYQPYKSAGDPQSDYEHGYTIGMKEGMIKGSR